MPARRKRPAAVPAATAPAAATPRICEQLDRFARLTGTVLFWLPLAMTLLTLIVVLARYGMRISLPMLQESVLYLHSAIITLAVGYTLERNGHVRIDFLYSRWPAPRRALVDILGTLFLLIPFCLILLNYCLDYTLQSWRVLEISANSHGLPLVYLQKSLLLAFPILLMLQGISMLVRRFSVLIADSHG